MDGLRAFWDLGLCGFTGFRIFGLCGRGLSILRVFMRGLYLKDPVYFLGLYGSDFGNSPGRYSEFGVCPRRTPEARRTCRPSCRTRRLKT